VALGDVNGDAIPDVVVANADAYAGTVSVLLGDGRGGFQLAGTYPAGTMPTSLALKDLSGDGKLDVAVANTAVASSVSVLLGKGDGTFQAPVTYAAGGWSTFVVAGDFNGDGVPDLVTADNITNTFSTFLGNGDGTFQARLTSFAGNHPDALTTGDFDGDGRPDLAATTSGGVGVFFGKGDGTFGSPAFYADNNNTNSIVTADLNGDGRLDLAASGTNGVSILFGKSGGSFQAAVNYPLGPVPTNIVAADLDGDGDIDLAVTIGNNRKVTILRNQLGTFRRQATYAVCDSPWGIAAGDLNGDGDTDLVAADNKAAAVTVLLGQGGGAFTAASPVYDLNNLAGAKAVLVGDVTGDGKPDLAFTNATHTVGILPDKGAGGFGPAQFETAGAVLVDVTRGDFDGNGVPDLAFADTFGSANVLLGAGGGAFQKVPQYATGPNPADVVTADLNGDGLADVATANYGQGTGNTVSVLLGKGDGSFGAAVSYAAGSAPVQLLAEDFNGDGVRDLAVLDGVNPGAAVSVLLGNGDGSFQAPRSSPVSGLVARMAAADFNGDGRTDLAVAVNQYNPTQGAVQVLLGKGDGTFRMQVTTTTYLGTAAIATGDFNGDGRADLATTSHGNSSNHVTVFLGLGDGTFQAGVNYDPQGVIGSSVLVVGDFTNDGRADLAVPTVGIPNQSWMDVFRGNGDGTFQAPVISPAGLQPEGAANVDYDGDGRLDLVVADGAANGGLPGVYLLRGKGDGSFDLGHRYIQPDNSLAVAVGDFNGDGRPDFAAANGGGWTVGVLLNLNGKGYHAPAMFPAGPVTSAAAVVAGDFNGYGLDDLATTNETGGTVSVLLAIGQGLFGAAVHYPLGSNPQDLVAADLNGDGRLDLATANGAGGTVSVLLGNGNGTFQPAVNYAAGPMPQGLAAGDFNGDGRLDLAVANAVTSGTVSVLLGAGGGTFLPPVAYPAGTLPQSIKAGDFDQDGVLDLAVANDAACGAAGVLLGRGDGTFQRPEAYTAGADTVALAVGDLNSDGYPDLAAAEKYGVTELSNRGA
jgi:hypothetical protein